MGGKTRERMRVVREVLEEGGLLQLGTPSKVNNTAGTWGPWPAEWTDGSKPNPVKASQTLARRTRTSTRLGCWLREGCCAMQIGRGRVIPGNTGVGWPLSWRAGMDVLCMERVQVAAWSSAGGFWGPLFLRRRAMSRVPRNQVIQYVRVGPRPTPGHHRDTDPGAESRQIVPTEPGAPVLPVFRIADVCDTQRRGKRPESLDRRRPIATDTDRDRCRGQPPD